MNKNMLPWLIGGGLALFLLTRPKQTVAATGMWVVEYDDGMSFLSSRAEAEAEAAALRAQGHRNVTLAQV